MSELNKVASVCANVYLQKKAAAADLLEQVTRGNLVTKALKDEAQSIVQLGKGKGMDDWMKVLLGVGGGKLLLDSQKNRGGWRR